ncbi:hypothetical protein Hanom_Chr01g00014221 [Helianthus anomalus]
MESVVAVGVLVVVVAVDASMDLTVAAMSQCADFISERSDDVNDFDPSFTELMHDSKCSGIGDGETAVNGSGLLSPGTFLYNLLIKSHHKILFYTRVV